jgi:hypothetical protein
MQNNLRYCAPNRPHAGWKEEWRETAGDGVEGRWGSNTMKSQTVSLVREQFELFGKSHYTVDFVPGWDDFVTILLQIQSLFHTN